MSRPLFLADSITTGNTGGETVTTPQMLTMVEQADALYGLVGDLKDAIAKLVEQVDALYNRVANGDGLQEELELPKTITLPDNANPRCRYLNAQEWQDLGVTAWAESTPYEVTSKVTDYVTNVCVACGGTFRASRGARFCSSYCKHIDGGRMTPRMWAYEVRREKAIEDAVR
jgi:endogenous inhibitor of DNA gyrase (YacG/DUF329 family)